MSNKNVSYQDLSPELKEVLDSRNEIVNQITKFEVISKFTNRPASITKIEPKYISLNFESWQSIKVDINRLEEYCDIPDEVKALIEKFDESLKMERRLSRKKSI